MKQPEAPAPVAPTVKFLGENCIIAIRQYNNGRPAIQLWCDEGPMGTATKNFPDIEAAEDEIFVADYSEHEGMPKALIDAGIGEEIGEFEAGGFGARIAVLKVTHPWVLEQIAKLPKMEPERPAPAPQAKKTPQPDGPTM